MSLKLKGSVLVKMIQDHPGCTVYNSWLQVKGGGGRNVLKFGGFYNLDLLERFSMQTIGEKNNDLSAFCVLLSFSCLCVCVPVI